MNVNATALKYLKKLYDDPIARFKSSEQALAVRLALQKRSDVLVILPTGGGKSLVFQLAASIESTLTTVLIIPFVALLDEMAERCSDMGLQTTIYQPGKDLRTARSQIIIAGAEHAVSSDFQLLLVQLESSKQLSRIVIDECHTLITQLSFRPIMRRMGSLVRCVDCQILLLTATLPPSMVERLRIILGCEKLDIVRRLDDRKEMEYSVIDLGSTAEDMNDLNIRISGILFQEHPKWSEADRGIIYCLQTKWTEEFARFLNQIWDEEICGYYHSNMERDQRDEMLQRWRVGDLKFMAATSALSVGIDYPHVRLILHQGYGRNLIDLCQETGRGGRDGENA